MKKIVGMVLCGVLFFNSYCFGEETLKVATTTSTYETGLLDYIFPPFEKKNNIKLHVISVGTGKAFKLGENGDVDVILVHARELEDRFIEDGYGVRRYGVMSNDFVILGPEEDPAGITGLEKADLAFRKISDSKYIFISRGDDSGTHEKEKSLWKKSGVNPNGAWYLQTGQGMSATLRVADEKNAYVMIDRGTYLFNKDNLRLRLLLEGDEDLFNPYGVIPINPYKHPHVRYDLAVALIEWLVSPECQEMIDEYKIDGERLFYANASDK